MSNILTRAWRFRPFDAETGTGLLLLLLGAILCVRIAGLALSQADLYFDEAQYWSWAQQPAFGYYTKPPLIAWLIGIGTSVCRDSPLCVRLPSPFVHMATALLVFATARRLFDQRTAFWSALLYNLMPGISLSSTLMSTDVPLLFFWTLGLLAVVMHVQRPSLGAGALLGVAVGLGILAKYAMLYLVGCFALYALFTASVRPLLKHPGTWLALVIAALLIAPNVVWNAQHAFATFSHTRSNVGEWGALFPNLKGLLEFVGAQIGIMGPAVFAAFAMTAAGAGARIGPAPKRFLLFFSVPILLLITGQSVMAIANGNWAATAFPAAVILGTAAMLSMEWRRGLSLSLWVAVVAGIVLTFSGAFAGRFTYGPAGRELGKLVGWSSLAADVRRVSEREKIPTVVLSWRGLTASMIYELRNSGVDVRAWLAEPGHPQDHFEMTRPWVAGNLGPVLFLAIGNYTLPRELASRATLVETFPTDVYITRRTGGTATLYRID